MVPTGFGKTLDLDAFVSVAPAVADAEPLANAATQAFSRDHHIASAAKALDGILTEMLENSRALS